VSAAGAAPPRDAPGEGPGRGGGERTGAARVGAALAGAALAGAGLGALAGAALAFVRVVAPQGWLAAGLPWLAAEALAVHAVRGTLIGAAAGALAGALLGRRPGARRALAGRTLRLAAALPALLALGGAALLPALRPLPDAPNLLLLSVDTLRADRLGCYGHAAARTPRIDALAARGTLHETVIASAPVTLTATSTLMTGLDPVEHGAHYNGYYRLGPRATTLAEVLADRGWRTGAVIGNFALSARFGTDQGFGHFDDTMTQFLQPGRTAHRGDGGDATDEGRDGETWWTRHLRTQPVQRPADEVTDAALAWLERRDAAPWFLWVHYMDPHSPYAPPPEFRDVGSPYDGEVAFVDREIGRLLDGLGGLDGPAARAPGRPTVIVLVADHGENLGEHGYSGHVRSVDEPSLRVPLIVVDPRAEGGRRETAPRRGRDVAGLVLGALGVRDVPPALRAVQPGGGDWWAYAQTYASRFLDGEEPTRVLRERRWKFVDRPGEADALFDLEADPAEDADASAVQPERLAAMRARLAEYAGDVRDAPDAVDDATRAVLEQLGYVGDH
jgi:arylsulfatase A-like enzyme